MSKASWDQLQDREMEPRPPGKTADGEIRKDDKCYQTGCISVLNEEITGDRI